MQTTFKPSWEIVKPRNIFAILISILCLAWAFQDFNFSHFKTSVKNAEFGFIFFASVLLTASVWIRAQRWQWLINVDKKPPIKGLFEIEMIGYFANNVFPLRAGEFIRAYLLKKKYDIKASFGLGTIAMERLSDTFGLLLLGLLLVAFYPLPDEMQKWVYSSGLFIFLLLLFIPILIKFSSKLKNKSGWKGVVFGFLQGLAGIKKDKILNVFIYTGIIWAMYWLDTHLVQRSLNLELTIWESLLVLIITSMAMSVPSAPGMVGTFHAAVKFTMVQILGHDPDIANSFSIILHAYGFICLTLIGAFFFISENLKK